MKQLKQILKLLSIVFIFLFTYSDNSMAQEEKTKILSWIEQETHTKNLIFSAYFMNESFEKINNFSYEFYGWKNGKSGRSKVKQSGKFEAPPEEKIFLSKIEFNLDNTLNDSIELQLKIFHENILIATDTIKYKP
ncbi:MAG: hypothetical protein R6U04_04195 [Bacteroidales bacterium]